VRKRSSVTAMIMHPTHIKQNEHTSGDVTELLDCLEKGAFFRHNVDNVEEGAIAFPESQGWWLPLEQVVPNLLCCFFRLVFRWKKGVTVRATVCDQGLFGCWHSETLGINWLGV
jgi:hypothetical protein